MKQVIISIALGLSLSTSLSVNAETPGLVVNLAEQKRAIAIDLSHQYAAVSNLLRNEINQYDLDISANQLLQDPQLDHGILERSDQSMRVSKGLPLSKADNKSLVRIRLADSSMLAPWQNGQSPLFAFAPDGNDSEWQAIEAYDIDGKLHLLDVHTLPEQPVFVVELDGKAVMKEGLEIMRATFANANKKSISLEGSDINSIQRSLPKSTNDFKLSAAAEPISTTVLSNISLKDDEEPWISGAAEVYAIVTGVNPSRDEPVLDIVELPYLDYDGTTYHPNQVLIHWERYRWAAADVLLMEHDDGTNYKVLAGKLLEAAEAIMRMIPDAQSYAIIPQITNGILQAMPDAWFTNDDDYVDVYYTLFEGTTYNYHPGASNNATATFTPLIIQPR